MPFFAHNIHCTAVERDNLFDKVQPNAESTNLAFIYIGGTVKPLEQLGQLRLGYANPLVTDSNTNRRILPFDLDLHHAACRAIFDGILYKVV